MRNENGKRVRVEEPPARPAEAVVTNRRVERRTSSSDTSSSQNSCLSTVEEVKEEVSSPSDGDDYVVVGCRSCGMYTMVFRRRQRCFKCLSYNVINFENFVEESKRA